MCDGKRVRLLGLCDREHKARELTDAEDKIVRLSIQTRLNNLRYHPSSPSPPATFREFSLLVPTLQMPRLRGVEAYT
jgi:hypothetical protein